MPPKSQIHRPLTNLADLSILQRYVQMNLSIYLDAAICGYNIDALKTIMNTQYLRTCITNNIDNIVPHILNSCLKISCHTGAAHTLDITLTFIKEIVSQESLTAIQSDDFVTQLKSAIFANKLDNVKILVQHGANLNIRKDDMIDTLLISAIRCGAQEISDFLLDQPGIDYNQTNSTGFTPISVAHLLKQSKIVKKLKKKSVIEYIQINSASISYTTLNPSNFEVKIAANMPPPIDYKTNAALSNILVEAFSPNPDIKAKELSRLLMCSDFQPQQQEIVIKSVLLLYASRTQSNKQLLTALENACCNNSLVLVSELYNIEFCKNDARREEIAVKIAQFLLNNPTISKTSVDTTLGNAYYNLALTHSVFSPQIALIFFQKAALHIQDDDFKCKIDMVHFQLYGKYLSDSVDPITEQYMQFTQLKDKISEDISINSTIQEKTTQVKVSSNIRNNAEFIAIIKYIMNNQDDPALDIIRNSDNLQSAIENTRTAMTFIRGYKTAQKALKFFEKAKKVYPSIQDANDFILTYEKFFAYYNNSSYKEAQRCLDILNNYVEISQKQKEHITDETIASYDMILNNEKFVDAITLTNCLSISKSELAALDISNTTYIFYLIDIKSFTLAKKFLQYLLPENFQKISLLIQSFDMQYQAKSQIKKEEMVQVEKVSFSADTQIANTLVQLYESPKEERPICEESPVISIDTPDQSADTKHGIRLPKDIIALANMISLNPNIMSSLSQKVLNLYYNYLKVEQEKTNLLDLWHRQTSHHKWHIDGNDYIFDENSASEVFKLEDRQSYYIAISKALLEHKNIAFFDTALNKGRIARNKGQDGVKILGSIIELKSVAVGDVRLYTNKIYQDNNGNKLILFDNIGNHKDIKKLANTDGSLDIINLIPSDTKDSDSSMEDLDKRLHHINEEYYSIMGKQAWIIDYTN